MRSATINIPNDLDAELDDVAQQRNVSPEEVIEAALRKYLDKWRRDHAIEDTDDFRPFWVPVIPEKDDHGEPDVSINHDYYLVEDLYKRRFSEL